MDVLRKVENVSVFQLKRGRAREMTAHHPTRSTEDWGTSTGSFGHLSCREPVGGATGAGILCAACTPAASEAPTPAHLNLPRSDEWHATEDTILSCRAVVFRYHWPIDMSAISYALTSEKLTAQLRNCASRVDDRQLSWAIDKI